MSKTYRELSGVHGHNLSDYSIPITGMSHTTARQYNKYPKKGSQWEPYAILITHLQAQVSLV